MKTKDLDNLSKLYEGVRTGMGNLVNEMANAPAPAGGGLPQIPGWQLNRTQNGDIHVLHEETGLNLQFNDKGELNSPDGPAVFYTEPNPGLIEIYMQNGKKHNDSGPAVKLKNGYEEYFLNDQNMSKKEFDDMMVHRSHSAAIGAEDEGLGDVSTMF